MSKKNLSNIHRFMIAFDRIENLSSDAPRLPKGVWFRHRQGCVELCFRTHGILPRFLRPYLADNQYLAEAVCMRHAMEVGAWWHRQDRSRHYVSVEPVDSGVWFWSVRCGDDKPSYDHGEAQDQASAHILALESLVNHLVDAGAK